MGFTVLGPDHFLGSGHPDFRDTQLYQPGRRPLLGLIESRDAGQTWEPLSLLGEADFHALQVAHGRVYGYDATDGRFMATSDRRHWQVRSKLELTSFAVSPTDPELVVAATERGLARSRDGGRRWQPIRGPAGLLLDWPSPDALWATTDDGQLWHSKDAGRSWRQPGKINGQPEAFLAHKTNLYVAVAQLGIVTRTTRAAAGGYCTGKPHRPDSSQAFGGRDRIAIGSLLHSHARPSQWSDALEADQSSRGP